MPPEVLRYAGFGNEGVFGTAVPAGFHVDIKSASLDAPSGTEMLYPGGISRGLRTRRPGYYRPSGNIVYAWDIRTIAAMLRWALGGYAFTPGAPNSHEIYGTQDLILPSFTSRIGKDVFEHVFAGCVCESLELGLAEDFLLATMVVSARDDSKAELTAEPDLLLPDEFPLAFHEVRLELPSGSDVSANVKKLNLSIKNNNKGDAGRGIGSRFPARLPAGARDVSLAFDTWYESTDHYESLWGGASGPSAGGSTDYPIKITADGGDDGSLELLIPSAHFSKVAAPPSGREAITMATEVTTLEAPIELADSATTIRSELLATVLNGAGDLSEAES